MTKKASQRSGRRGRAKRAASGVYTRAEREIYRYCGGCAKGPLACKDCRAKDPLEIHQTLLSFPELDLETDLQRFASELVPDKAKYESFERLLAASQAAFGVKVWDEETATGLTRGEIMGLLLDFGIWVDALKKKHGILPTSPKPTAPVPPAGSVTPTGLDSGATASESSAAEPQPSPPASPQPSVENSQIPSSVA